MEKCILLASDNIEIELPKISSLSKNFAAVNYRGKSSKVSKVHPNEDSSAIVALSNRSLIENEKQANVFLASIGDCYGYYVSPKTGDSAIINRIEACWIGSRRGLSDCSLDIKQYSFQSGSILLLATDGLPECKYGKLTITKEDIAKVVKKSSNSLEACKKLLEMSQDLGGEDNVAITIKKIE